jgi:hypothetical protein
VIGGAVGAVAGGLTGAAVDENKREAKAAAVAAAQAQRGPLGLQEIADLTRNGSGDAVIIDQIRLTGSVYNLSAEQIVWLKQNSVSDAVIHEMQLTAYRTAPRPVQVVQPVYVVDPGPPPPVGVGVGVRFGGR